MIVRSIRHRGLRQLCENNPSRLLKQDLVERVRRNEWSMSVSGNWRIAFEERDGGIERVNLEDCHR